MKIYLIKLIIIKKERRREYINSILDIVLNKSYNELNNLSLNNQDTIIIKYRYLLTELLNYDPNQKNTKRNKNKKIMVI